MDILVDKDVATAPLSLLFLLDLLVLAACSPLSSRSGPVPTQARDPDPQSGGEHLHLAQPRQPGSITLLPDDPDPTPEPATQWHNEQRSALRDHDLPATGRYTVTVAGVALRELLHALARDAGVNVDIAPNVEGTVSLNAVDQSLPGILERLARQVPIRYEFVAGGLLISADTPYFKHYTLDYPNIARSSKETVMVSTQIGSASGTEGGQGNNTSSTAILAESHHDTWEQLHAALAAIVGEADEDAGGQKVVINRQAGLIMVHATARQHRQVQALLNRLVRSIRRQVLIQATVVEVELKDEFRAGIDWSSLDLGGAGASLATRLVGARRPANPGDAVLLLEYLDQNASGNRVQLAVELLSRFGEARVLSSPQIRVLNNHTAVLKVVENFVYFEVQQDLNSGSASAGTGPLLATTTIPHTIPVGLIMTVTPQIGADHSVMLSVRPTISSVIRTEQDPNPSLTTVENRIPVVRVREMESVLRMHSNQVAILGGLMQDTSRNRQNAVPLLSGLPFIGKLFQGQQRQSVKTELVIFMRPIVLTQQV